jgi:hypothetical protein
MLMNANVKFLQGKDFMLSLRTLHHKGGAFQKAAKTIQAAWGRANLQQPLNEVFAGIPTTNHGESRIPHCVKYDLTQYSRLVTVVNNGVCVFLFCGDHDTVDSWLDKNKGLDFVARQFGNSVVIDPTRVSDLDLPDGRITAESDLSEGALVEKLPRRYCERLIAELPDDVEKDLRAIESVSSDDDIQTVALLCGDPDRQLVVLDVLLSLKSGDLLNAKLRIDTWTGKATPVESLPVEQKERIASGDSTVLIQDLDPVLFQHFVQTATFDKWMLFLHPAQREYVDKDFAGPARLSGVSGSGKTCVVVHRTLRLADKYPEEPILVVTLNDALAALIDRLINAARGASRPKNIYVTSIFELCFQKLMEFEPEKRDYYTKRTIAKNPHAVSEDVDEIWREYFFCENNNRDADAMLEVVQTLSVRGVYASDYLRQELDYIRSSFRKGFRDEYLKMEREGRVIPLEERFRLSVLDGLDGWERKMDAVGVVDDMGIVSALARHIRRLTPKYRCTIVDEVQDLGTLELEVLRRLTMTGENDIFLCGDAAQRIYTKHADLDKAGIDITGRAAILRQNYRNSREILTAAHAVLTRSLEAIPRGPASLEVLRPEFASFSSPKPLLFECADLTEEIAYAAAYVRAVAADAPNQKHCIAICGYSQSAVEKIANQLALPALSAMMKLGEDAIFISDLEQTKGFEFDTVIIVNCSATSIPHPNLPQEESFRDLSRLYVAMTRAKTQLLVSFTASLSPFIVAAESEFVRSRYEEHVSRSSPPKLEMPAASIPRRREPFAWQLTGDQFLKTLDAVGLPRNVQDVIKTKVSGRHTLRGSKMKQLSWQKFEEFYSAMQNPRNRNEVISKEAWESLYRHFG